MKKLIIGLIIALPGLGHAARVDSAKINLQKEALEVSVSYGGGCSKHSFELEVNPACSKTMPARCVAKIIHTMDEPDLCEAFITDKISFSLAKYFSDIRIFSSAKLTIYGDGDSKATVQLPNNWQTNVSDNDKELERDALEVLIAEAGNIELVDAAGDKLDLGEEKSFAQVLVSQLTDGYLKAHANQGGNIILKDTTVSCMNITPAGIVGSSSYRCKVQLINGYFSVNKNDYLILNGPDTESGLMLEVFFDRAVVPKAKLKLRSKKIKAEFAG